MGNRWGCVSARCCCRELYCVATLLRSKFGGEAGVVNALRFIKPWIAGTICSH